ncbi:MAG: hypothetical protein ACLSFT_06835 [Ruminococcus callidus]
MRSRERFLSHWKGRLLHSGIHILPTCGCCCGAYSVLMGVLVGFIGIAFVCYTVVTTFRTGHWWTVLTLPPAVC